MANQSYARLMLAQNTSDCRLLTNTEDNCIAQRLLITEWGFI